MHVVAVGRLKDNGIDLLGTAFSLLSNGVFVKSKHVVLNMVAQRGQSGSPVIDAARKSLVAVLIGAYARDRGVTVRFGGMDVTTPHQTTHAVSAQYLERR